MLRRLQCEVQAGAIDRKYGGFVTSGRAQGVGPPRRPCRFTPAEEQEEQEVPMPTDISWVARTINCTRKKATVVVQFQNPPFNPAFADEAFSLVAGAPAMRDALNTILNRHAAGDGPGLQAILVEVNAMLVKAKLR
jgi:hypothetical protein